MKQLKYALIVFYYLKSYFVGAGCVGVGDCVGDGVGDCVGSLEDSSTPFIFFRISSIVLIAAIKFVF